MFKRRGLKNVLKSPIHREELCSKWPRVTEMKVRPVKPGRQVMSVSNEFDALFNLWNYFINIGLQVSGGSRYSSN